MLQPCRDNPSAAVSQPQRGGCCPIRGSSGNPRFLLLAIPGRSAPAVAWLGHESVTPPCAIALSPGSRREGDEDELRVVKGVWVRRKPSARGRAVRSRKREGAGMGRRGSGPQMRANKTAKRVLGAARGVCGGSWGQQRAGSGAATGPRYREDSAKLLGYSSPNF